MYNSFSLCNCFCSEPLSSTATLPIEQTKLSNHGEKNVSNLIVKTVADIKFINSVEIIL